MAIERGPAIEKILTALKEGQPEYSACGAGGVSYSAWYDWKRDTPGLQERVVEARRARITLVEDALFKTAIKGSVQAQLAFLERYDAEWRDRLKDSAGKTLVLDGTAAVMLSMMDPAKKQKFIGALHVAGLLPETVLDIQPSTNGHSNGNSFTNGSTNGSAH